MIVDTSLKDAYEAVSDIIDKVMVEKYGYYSSCLVELETSVLGPTVEYLKFYGNGPYFLFDKDWYEGGTINLISFIPISEINSIGEISGAHIF